AGVELGRVLEIAEGYGHVTPAAESAIQFDVATPVQPGRDGGDSQRYLDLRGILSWSDCDPLF
ncbi:MAG TPA: hypothetical protein PKV83_05375, partial [Methanothrix sp.]|nr:hypothetical protein [Methanothrix sp.]